MCGWLPIEQKLGIQRGFYFYQGALLIADPEFSVNFCHPFFHVGNTVTESPDVFFVKTDAIVMYLYT